MSSQTQAYRRPGGKNDATPLLLVLFGGTVGLVAMASLPAGLGIAVAIPALILFSRCPELAMLVYLSLFATIFTGKDLPYVPIGIGSFQITDLIQLFLYGLIVWRVLTQPDFKLRRCPVNLPLALFFLASIFAVKNGISRHGAEYSLAMRTLRDMSTYFLFYPVLQLIRTRRQFTTLAVGVAVLASAVGFLMLLQAGIGEKLTFISGRVEELETMNMTYSATRVLPPGESLILAMILVGTCWFAFLERKRITIWNLGLIGLTAAGVLLTYNRSYWVTILLSLGLLVLLGGRQARRRIAWLAAVGLLSLTIAISGSVLATSGKSFDRLYSSVVARFSSLLQGDKLIESNSLNYRALENRFAIPMILSHPLVGLGLGTEYRPNYPHLHDDLRHYVHNGYFYLLLNYGLLGFIPFISYFLMNVFRAARFLPRIVNPVDKGLVAGFCLYALGMLMIDVVNPMFMQDYSIATFTVLAGLSQIVVGRYLSENGPREGAKQAPEPAPQTFPA